MSKGIATGKNHFFTLAIPAGFAGVCKLDGTKTKCGKTTIMGLSIHYQGRIKEYNLIDEMIAETEDICKSMNWKYQVFEPQNTGNEKKTPPHYTPHDVKGISFTPEESETVFITFLHSGILCSPIKLIYYDPVSNDLMIEWVSVKTQYAGPDTHIAVLKLLDYLSKKYFESFELNDEGDYWEKWDKEILLNQFSRYNFLVNTVRDAFAGVKLKPGENIENFADRIEQILLKKIGDNPDISADL